MYLLKVDHDGNFSLIGFRPNDIPPYAILSHTWEADDQELTFQEMTAGTGRSKAGYRKIQFCGNQAKKDGLDYFWVDSCCIDRKSSAELSEAINSMFSWYQDAVKCYVYLSDVTNSERILSVSKTLPDSSPFRQSKWFTRGWTLQELLAPSTVEFFSREKEFIGDKNTLDVLISNITGIPCKALHGTSMSCFSLDERMSWASKRHTTIEEDQVYCLLGIFEAHMPLIYGEGRKNATRRLREISKFISKQEPFSTVPFAPDLDFVDRPEILALVRDKCAGPGARAALVGLGGVGKSQIAIQYCYDVRHVSPQKFVFWVHASSRARFESAYRDIADRLELPGRANPESDVLRLVDNWLREEANGQWTMILDNVDDIETFFPESSERVTVSLATYLPQNCNGSILITSRNKDAASRLAGGYKNIMEVQAMDQSQGLQLFRNKLQDASKEEGAADLLHALDNIPLAITQAAAFINRRGRLTASGYLEEFRKNDKKKERLLNWDSGDLRRDLSASNSITTWQMSFERIREQRRSAADLLSLMSFFNAQGIPEWTLRSHCRSMVTVSDMHEADSEFDEDLDTLQAYSLISATVDSGVWEMHALVQFCTRVWLSAFTGLERWNQKFVKLMAKEFPRPEFETWTKCQQLLPHVTWLYSSELSGKGTVEEWADVLDKAGWYIYSRLGKYDEAEKLYRCVLEKAGKELGVQNSTMLATMGNLSIVLENQGQYKEAEKLNRRVLKWYEDELGTLHPATLTSLNNLALVLDGQGDYNEAEKLIRQALAVEQTHLGVQHPDTLTSLGNLAAVLKKQGKYNEAEKLYRQVLAEAESELDVQHPDTVITLGNLAVVLGKQGKYNEAEKLHRQVLAGRESQLGVQHPDTLISLSNLAMVLGKQGKHGEAEKLHRQVLAGRESHLGVLRPDTMTSLRNLAVTLQRQGKCEEAEKLNRRALEGFEKELGVLHPETLRSVYALAYLLHKQSRYDEAEELYQRACKGFQQTLGPRHPRTIACLKDFTVMQQGAQTGLHQAATEQHF